MAASPTLQSIRQDIAKGNLAPVYLLHGEEGYFIDLLVKEFEKILPEADREFNQYILYAPQVLPGQVMDLCYRYPMMAERQVVILKECQAVNANQINPLHKYVENPSKTTVFVMVFRGEKAKGKDLVAQAKKHAVVFESPKIKENNLLPYIDDCIKQKGMRANPKALEILRDHIGNDISRINNEVEKLSTILGPNATITPEVIERNIGVSKDYNLPELVDALATKNAEKAMRIIDYFESNPKAFAAPMVVAFLYGFFSDLLIAYYAKSKTDEGIMAALGQKSTYIVRTRIRPAMQRYNAYQVIEAIWALREFDGQSKGNGSRQDPIALFRDLVFHLLTAPGNLGV